MQNTVDYDTLKLLIENNYESSNVDGKTYYFNAQGSIVANCNDNVLNIYYGPFDDSNYNAMLSIVKGFKKVKKKDGLKVQEVDIAILNHLKPYFNGLSSNNKVTVNYENDTKILENPSNEIKSIKKGHVYKYLPKSNKAKIIRELKAAKKDLTKNNSKFTISPIARPVDDFENVNFPLPEGRMLSISKGDLLSNKEDLVIHEIYRRDTSYVKDYNFKNYMKSQILVKTDEDYELIDNLKNANYKSSSKVKVLNNKKRV